MPRLISGTERPRAPLLESYITDIITLHRGRINLCSSLDRELFKYRSNMCYTYT